MNDTLGTSYPLLFLAGLLCGLGTGSFFWVRHYRRRSKYQENLHRDTLADLQQKAGQEHAQRARLLERLNTPFTPMNDILDWRDLGNLLLETATALLPSNTAAFLALDSQSRLLEARAARGLSDERIRTFVLRSGEGVCGRALESGQIVLMEDLKSAGSLHPLEQFLKPPYAVIPLQAQRAGKAVLALSYAAHTDFAKELAQLIQGYGSFLIDHLSDRQRVDQNEQELIRGLLRCVETKDHYTHGHLERTAYIAQTFARELRLPQGIVHQIEVGALLHDIGKIGIPDAILCKPSALSVEEYAEIKKHPDLGFRIMRSYAFLRGAAFIILHHQEWFNGSGYPHGLSREEIPLGARLVTIVDAWDAMTSNRPYRVAMSRVAAIAELRRHAGTQFDPQLIDPFFTALDHLTKEGLPTTEGEALAASAHASSETV